MWFVARDDARGIVVFAGGDIVMQRRGRGPSLMIFARDTDPDRIGGDAFGTHGGDRLQQEVAELGEGGGFLARDAALREQAENLAERAVHAGGGGEIAAGGI